MLGYAIAAPNLQNYSSQGRRGLNIFKPLFLHPYPTVGKVLSNG
jgi:hypothetical protein